MDYNKATELLKHGNKAYRAALLEEYIESCKDIATECEEEGLPGHGDTYELRCSSLWDGYYQPEFDALDDREIELAAALDEMIALGWTLETFDEDFDSCDSSDWTVDEKETCREVFTRLWEERKVNKAEYIIPTGIELADLQNTICVLMEKLKWYKENYPYATYDIDRMETVIDVLRDYDPYEYAHIDGGIEEAERILKELPKTVISDLLDIIEDLMERV